MARHTRFESRYGTTGTSDWVSPALSRGELLRRLELLIIEAKGYVKAFAEGRTVHIGYIRDDFKNRVQHCLLDIGDFAHEELHQIAVLDLRISDDLQRYYDHGIFNDFDVKSGDPSEFLQLQDEYNQTMPPKLQEIIKLLNQVRDKMLDRPTAAHPGEKMPTRHYGPKPAMERHRSIAEVVRQCGDRWQQEDELEQVAAQLDSQGIEVSKEWAKWKPSAPRNWKRAVLQKPENVVKAIKYSLNMARKQN